MLDWSVEGGWMMGFVSLDCNDQLITFKWFLHSLIIPSLIPCLISSPTSLMVSMFYYSF